MLEAEEITYQGKQVKMHLCNSEHKCKEMCQAKGICTITYTAEERKWELKSGGSFQYEYIRPQIQQNECNKLIQVGQLEHPNDHCCLKSPAEHTCDNRCKECLTFCSQFYGHKGNHQGNHRNKENQIFIQDVQIKEEGKEIKQYKADESSQPEKCHESCSRRSRSHYHLVLCLDSTKCLTKSFPKHSEHGFNIKGKTYDKILCTQFWQNLKWVSPITDQQKLTDVSLCNYFCKNKNHNGQKQFFCNSQAWHTFSNNYEEHSFDCADVHKEEKKFQGIQISFCIDTTGSMSSYIEESKNAVQKVIQSCDKYLKENNLNPNVIEFAIVDYNDHDTEAGPDYQNIGRFAAKTSGWQNYNNAIYYLNQLKADGGGDGPEAVFDGLHLASTLKWDFKKDKYLFIIGDAPPHGKIFHSGQSDKWENGDEPCGLCLDNICSALRNIAGLQLQIYQYKINDEMNLLIQKMRNNGLQIQQLKLNSEENPILFEDKVAQLVCQQLVDREVTYEKN